MAHEYFIRDELEGLPGFLGKPGGVHPRHQAVGPASLQGEIPDKRRPYIQARLCKLAQVPFRRIGVQFQIGRRPAELGEAEADRGTDADKLDGQRIVMIV
jgi:hypothetical protein